MKIKNIKDYRTFFKSKRLGAVSPDLEEHFIGNYYDEINTDERKYGWFTLYHGVKDGFGKPQDGIINFLESFLEMAKDGQAVYEFLQNAVDAKSTHFTMVFGQDNIDGNYYLLVANNGKMFDFDSISSILNVGSSTKTNNSQTIGKFGIGFKLAHRLVGKSNGLDEVIYDNSGPILFSWKKYDIEQLSNNYKPIPEIIAWEKKDKNNYIITDDNPWLFKILITCFPCLPENESIEDFPRMADGKTITESPFSVKEYEVLSRWIKNNQHIINKDNYNEGSLFFIKLGQGKVSELAEINLKEGVKFALAILKETADEKSDKERSLKTVQLNAETPITLPDLQYIRFNIDKVKEQDTYSYIRFGVNTYDELSLEQKNKINAEANIEILFGFRKHNEIGDYFKGAPNLYLYFPLSEEVHNFNYILHSNAFYKGSSRTFLHEGSGKEDGINERLLKTIVIKIDEVLKKLSSSTSLEDRNLFLDFYAALLTSGKSENDYRKWIEVPYINEINKLLKKYIPVRKSFDTAEFEILNNADHVFNLQTKININTEIWDIKNVYWFYWENLNGNDHSTYCNKLGISEYTAFNLLNEGTNIISHLNEWLDISENNIMRFLTEISTIDKTLNTQLFRETLFELKFLKFTNGEALSINQFQQNEFKGYFIIHNALHDITDIFKKLDLIFTIDTLNFDNFINIYLSYFSTSSSHKSYTNLVRLFSKIVKNEKITSLNKNEKLRIFNAFKNFNNDKIGERIKELKLFNNNHNIPTQFKNLFASSEIGWLKKFCINPLEYDIQLKDYLLNNDVEIYEYIVCPFWKNILIYITQTTNESAAIFNDIINTYEKSTWSEKLKNNLNNYNLIIFQGEVIESNKIYFNTQLLQNTNEGQYFTIQSIVLKYYGCHIPDKTLLSYIGKPPFSYAICLLPQINYIETSIEDLDYLLSFCKVVEHNFFQSNRIIKIENNFFIDVPNNKPQIATEDKNVITYIDTYYTEKYLLLPNCFQSYSNMVEFSATKLIEHLIHIFTEDDNLKQELDLVEIVLVEKLELKKLLLSKLTFTCLDALWENEKQNEFYLKLLQNVINDVEIKEMESIHNKIQINKKEVEINIGKIESANDGINVKRDKIEIILSQSQILHLEGAEDIKLVREFHDEVLRRGLLTPTEADKLFKISNAGITPELVSRFNNGLKEKQIVNTHQLLFVLLSDKFAKDEFEKYSIKFQDDKWYPIEQQLVLHSEQNAKYINPIYIVHHSYENLQLLLQLNDLENYTYTESESSIIIPQFLFIKGCSPEILATTEPVVSFLDYLFNAWIHLSATLRVHKRNENWESILGLIPANYIIGQPHVIADTLPETFSLWHNNDKRKSEFLKAVGVNTEVSEIIQLRKWLLSPINQCQVRIESEHLNDQLLINTLNGLCNGFEEINDQIFIYDDIKNNDQIFMIEKIIKHLIDKSIQKVPIFIYNSTTAYELIDDTTDCYHIDQDTFKKLIADSNNSLNELFSRVNIIKYPEIVTQIHTKCKTLPLEEQIINTNNANEHDEPFYRTWKSECNIRLFRVEELLYSSVLNFADKTKLQIGTLCKNEFQIIKIEEQIIIYYLKNISLEELEIKIKVENLAISNNIAKLIEKRNIMLTSFYNTFNAAGKDEFNSEHLKSLELAFKEENLKQERKSLIDSINNSNDYSYNWFVAYLKYLLTFGNIQDTTKRQSLKFQKIKRYIVNDVISDNFLLLCGCNSIIPLNIQDFEDFKIKLVIRNSKDESIVVEGAQKTGQDLLVYCREPIKQEVAQKFSDVLQVKISFSPIIDLLERLFKAFINRNNMAEWVDINTVLPKLHFIYGPPGTGKTTTICSNIIDAVKEKYNSRILFLTPTNKAADVLCKKLLKPNDDLTDNITKQLKELDSLGQSIFITRIGKPTDPELEALDKELYQDSVSLDILLNANIIASTIHRLPYYEILDKNKTYKLFQLENCWDYIIFDEASMLNLPYLVFAILALHKTNPNAKFILAGDPKQIPPVIDVNDKDLEELEIQDENIYKMLNILSFKPDEQKLRMCDSIQNLDTQYRSIKKIGQLFSELSYNDLLIHHRDKLNISAKPLPNEFSKLFSNNVNFIDIPLDRFEPIYRIDKLLYSSYHIYSAILVAEIVKFFDSTLKDDETWTVGLIAPYKAQAIILNKLITSYGLSDKLKIYADTVHGFQGDECDIVFFISNPNNYTFSGHPKCLLSKEYIYNVAISRAKDYLIILHPFDKINDNWFINKITQSYTKNFEKPEILKTTQIERDLFKKSDYIEKNSYITGHDNVNVFGQIDISYFIKKNDNAIDIQLRKLS